jgi:hypothetical protein
MGFEDAALWKRRELLRFSIDSHVAADAFGCRTDAAKCTAAISHS